MKRFMVQSRRKLVYIKVSTKITKGMGEESFFGSMGKHLKGSGEQAKKTVMGSGSLRKETTMKESGRIASKMAKVYSCMLEAQRTVGILRIF